MSDRRGRGRPSGTDSAETRANILRAARHVINERGYEAATFQAIAQRAGFSRPTMHYYFDTKEQIYDELAEQAHAYVAVCIAGAKRERGLLKQLAAFVDAARRSDASDGSVTRFIIASRLELHRNPSLRDGRSPLADAVSGFYRWMIEDAVRCGEIPDGTDAGAVADMLSAMCWGMGFFAGFVHSTNDANDIAKQLHRLLKGGLLDGAASARPLTVGVARRWAETDAE
ncbi:TetR family transcriptional regulator [Mycobacterium holsaticum DSM 44478]|uniref:TetR/AcrR family transcriptional regulator n=1 Tax=Mycolicibacterium holsaticum TaxID=152142 RepID=UPI0022EC467C|nr:TetR/AcrR family transcriptional regulator [Mycolicibacterium holsaticum]MDA4109470.1 TetR family transcriptional regulator [Mycolicibacterium holsaticum DSM 44478 = JCM 12374]